LRLDDEDIVVVVGEPPLEALPDDVDLRAAAFHPLVAVVGDILAPCALAGYSWFFPAGSFSMLGAVGLNKKTFAR